MNDKEAVRTIEPNACIERTLDGWDVREYPSGRRVIAHGSTPGRAWKAARMMLFGETIGGIISEIPVVEKGV